MAWFRLCAHTILPRKIAKEQCSTEHRNHFFEPSIGIISHPLPLQPVQTPVPPQRRHFFRLPAGSIPSPPHRGQFPVPLQPRHSTAPCFTSFCFAIVISLPQNLCIMSILSRQARLMQVKTLANDIANRGQNDNSSSPRILIR